MFEQMLKVFSELALMHAYHLLQPCNATYWQALQGHKALPGPREHRALLAALGRQDQPVHRATPGDKVILVRRR